MVSTSMRYKIWGIAILTTLSFATTMYALWSYVGARFIENLAGKYFIPIFPIFLLAFALPHKIYDGLKIEKNVVETCRSAFILGGGLLWSFGTMIWAVWSRYYY